MNHAKRLLLGLLLLWTVGLLSGCAVMQLQGERVSSTPNLAQLHLEPYQDASIQGGEGDGATSYLRVDFWLEASQVMGGIHGKEDSLYPHFGRSYREGGFHYRWNTTVGWYENVLRNMLSTAEGARVRILRVGNERLPDEYLRQQGLLDEEDPVEAYASTRRDLLTYTVNPLPSVFSELSAENMAGSFYSLGSPMLNQMARFAGDGGAELENPGRVEEMSAALAKQIEAIAALSQEGGSQEGKSLLAQQSREDKEAPLYYALENIDTSRLSVILFDPATLRRLSGTEADGKPAAYYEDLLRERGVFDKGLSVGMYAFQLDYMGQMSSIGPADLEEAFIWGKPIYNSYKKEIEAIAAMPRILIAFVIGREAQVEDYMASLSSRLEDDKGLQGLRGPEKGELSYARNGQTVTQQPFSFAYWQTVISRPNAGFYTQHTQGAQVNVSEGQGAVSSVDGLMRVTLAPDQRGSQENRTLTIAFPLEQAQEDARMDLSQLSSVGVRVLSSLLLTETLPNTQELDRQPAKNEQILTLRDKRFVYTYTKDLFLEEGVDSPFSVQSIGQSTDGDQLVCTLRVEGSALVEGYYRLEVCVDLSSDEVSWLPVEWIDGASSISASITNGEISQWEAFSAKIAEKEKGRNSIPKAFQHAWGAYTDKLYAGLPYPDCPPVEKAIGLAELSQQLRAAATADQVALVRYVFDVFVSNEP